MWRIDIPFLFVFKVGHLMRSMYWMSQRQYNDLKRHD
jgi:hypothetical protein